ncbi:MAG: isocitrate/isopropylmalate dehydrogenase [Alphaproteobacteria bacterium]|jgi:isocitrate/isopropylmalate dehydrogenase
MNILILPGDGIGPEIVAVAERVLVALNDRFSLGLVFERAEIGLASLENSGSTLPEDVAAKARAADGVVLGPVSTHIYPSAAEGGINVSAWCRTQLDLYANIRPSAVRAGVPSHVPAMDLVIVRENTEGFYADRNMAWGSGEFMPTEDVALAVGKATRAGCHRIAVAACELAMRRNRHLTVVHKANVLKKYSGLFLDTAREVAAGYPDLVVDDFIVDAMAALLVREPQNFDVIVTTNMFGDILSDEAAELAGGLGLASSLNAGDVHAVAQAAHGSAPDIAGQDIANPAAILHSTAMLLEHLGAKTSDNGLAVAAQCLVSGTDAVLADDSTRTRDLGGTGGTKAFGDALIERIREAQ